MGNLCLLFLSLFDRSQKFLVQFLILLLQLFDLILKHTDQLVFALDVLAQVSNLGRLITLLLCKPANLVVKLSVFLFLLRNRSR